MGVLRPLSNLKILIVNTVLVSQNVTLFMIILVYNNYNRRDGVVVRAFDLQSVDLGFNPFVESSRKTLKNGIPSLPAWCSAFRGGCGEQAGKFACCVAGQGI